MKAPGDQLQNRMLRCNQAHYTDELGTCICDLSHGHKGDHFSGTLTWPEPSAQTLGAPQILADEVRALLAAVAATPVRIRRLKVGDIEIEFAPPDPPAVEQPGTPTAEHPVIESLKDLFPNGLGARRSPGG